MEDLEGIIAVVLFLALVGVFVWVGRRAAHRRKRRAESLRQEEDGTWVWISLDGSASRSPERPDRTGGEWEREDAADGDGGDGGD